MKGFLLSRLPGFLAQLHRDMHSYTLHQDVTPPPPQDSRDWLQHYSTAECNRIYKIENRWMETRLDNSYLPVRSVKSIPECVTLPLCPCVRVCVWMQPNHHLLVFPISLTLQLSDDMGMAKGARRVLRNIQTPLEFTCQDV